jgi:Na+-transporting methylmalonyl-CoA/oxaloacetate decarboxylase gamma subunit
VEGPTLTSACITAFGVVFLVLAFLALVIRLIGLVFPACAPRADPAVVAAIAAAVATQQPGAKVVHIVEER